MKSLISFLLLVALYAPFSTAPVLAETEITINRPQLSGANVGFATIGDAINNIMVLAFIIAVIVVLAMLVWGGIEWMTSGGSKEQISSARGRITNALAGLIILAVAFAIFTIAKEFTGLGGRLVIPTPP